MRKKIVSEKPVTKAEMDVAFEKFRISFKEEIRDLLTQFRSDMFTRFDQVVGELAQIREDHLFMKHDIKGLKETDDEHKMRIKALEKRQKTSH